MMQAKKNVRKPEMIDILIENGAEPLPQLEPKKSQKLKKSQSVKKPNQPQTLLNSQPIDPNTRRNYMLTIYKDGNWEKVSVDEFNQFVKENPDVGKYLEDQNNLRQLELP
jgi:hypothetical protein